MSFLWSKGEVHIDPEIPKRSVYENLRLHKQTFMDQLINSQIFWSILFLTLILSITVYFGSKYPKEHLEYCKKIWNKLKSYYREKISIYINYPILITLIF